MYEVKVKGDFSGAHNLRNYKGACEALHGHNWHIEASVQSKTLNEHGMVMDFKDLRSALFRVLEGLDHKYLNDIPYFKKINPTSENIARFIHEKMGTHFLKVSVWETRNSCASFEK